MEKILYYIEQELKDESLTDINIEWLNILKEYYLGVSIKELAIKYNKSLQSLYRRKKKLEEYYTIGQKYQQKEKNNKLSLHQKEELKEIINDSPYKKDLYNIRWTGQLLRIYIYYVYEVEFSVRECQRLLNNYGRYLTEEDIITRYKDYMQELIRNKYEIWHIRNFIIWREKRNIISKNKLQLASKVEGVFLAYNPTNEMYDYKPYNNNGYNTYSGLIEEFIESKTNGVKLALVFPDNKKCQKKSLNMNNDKYYDNNKYKNVKVIIKPKQIKELQYIEEKRKLIKAEFRYKSKWSKFQYKSRKRITEILENRA